MNGPIILVWDAVKQGAIHPERGHNVVYHEFAHKLDMLDGVADGAPPLNTAEQYRQWETICQEAYDDLRRRTQRGQRSFLDAYGATDPAEFFREIKRDHREYSEDHLAVVPSATPFNLYRLKISIRFVFSASSFELAVSELENKTMIRIYAADNTQLTTDNGCYCFI